MFPRSLRRRPAKCFVLDSSKYDRLLSIFFVTENARRLPSAASSICPSSDRRTPSAICGEPSHNSGGLDPSPSRWDFAHSRTSSCAVRSRANPASAVLGTAITSLRKYQSAWGIVGQSVQAPSASRKSAASYKPRRVASSALRTPSGAAMAADAKNRINATATCPQTDGTDAILERASTITGPAASITSAAAPSGTSPAG